MRKTALFIKNIVSIGSVCALIFTTGCQKNPDSSIVVNKDMDQLIEKAQDTESGVTDVTLMAKEYDSYQTTLSDDSLHVKINVDAQVDIPEVSSLAVMRVKQHDITQEEVDRYLQFLIPGENLYDGSIETAKIKSDYEEQIRYRMNDLNNLQHDNNYDVMSAEIQHDIDRLQADYENAPETISLEAFQTDGKLHTVQEFLATFPNSEFYNWEKELNENGQILYVTNNKYNRERKNLYVQNNDNYGNVIRYGQGGNDNYSVWVNGLSLESIRMHSTSGIRIVPIERSLPKDLEEYFGAWNMAGKTDGKELLHISETDARAEADEFLKSLGLDNFEYADGGAFYGYATEDGDDRYQGKWIFQYTRCIDGVCVTFETTAKYEEGWSGDEYVKKNWPLECIAIEVDDVGVKTFAYNAPIDITETVVEKSAIKSFDEVKDTFEQMALVSYATDNEDFHYIIDVDRVVLGYSRVSEKDSYDTGLLVPTWDFMGTITRDYGDGCDQLNYGSVLTINAIDGSVIDRTLGY